jgi:hypothetical protein
MNNVFENCSPVHGGAVSTRSVMTEGACACFGQTFPLRFASLSTSPTRGGGQRAADELHAEIREINRAADLYDREQKRRRRDHAQQAKAEQRRVERPTRHDACDRARARANTTTRGVGRHQCSVSARREREADGQGRPGKESSRVDHAKVEVNSSREALILSSMPSLPMSFLSTIAFSRSAFFARSHDTSSRSKRPTLATSILSR